VKCNPRALYKQAFRLRPISHSEVQISVLRCKKNFFSKSYSCEGFGKKNFFFNHEKSGGEQEMSLSKKHYKTIAKILGDNAKPDPRTMPGKTPKILYHFSVDLNALVCALSLFFASDNPHYDEGKFRNAVRAACGLRPTFPMKTPR